MRTSLLTAALMGAFLVLTVAPVAASEAAIEDQAAVDVAVTIDAVELVAWDCKPGYADTVANEASGMCVEHTPTPVPPCGCTPTPVPPCGCMPSPIPTATPTATPSPTATAPTPSSTPAVVNPPSSPPPPPPNSSQPPSQDVPAVFTTNTVAMCHYEPTTGLWERRNVQPDQVEKREKMGDTLMAPGTVCAPPTAADVSTPLPTASQTSGPSQGPQIAVCHNDDSQRGMDSAGGVQSLEQRNVPADRVTAYLRSASGLDYVMPPGGTCGPTTP